MSKLIRQEMIKRTINIPPGLKGKHLDAYLHIANRLAKDRKVSSAFLSGSIFHGGYGPHSDLDIIAITTSVESFSQRIQDYVSDTFYELFMYSEQGLKESFSKGDYHDMHMVAFGYCIFGDEKTFANIKKEARRLFLKGPEVVSREDIKFQKYLLWDSYCDIIDILEFSPDLALSMMHETFWVALSIFYKENKVWFPKRKNILTSLSDIDQSLHKKVKSFLEQSDSKKSFDKFKIVTQHIVDPYNLDKPFIWKSKIKKG